MYTTSLIILFVIHACFYESVTSLRILTFDNICQPSTLQKCHLLPPNVTICYDSIVYQDWCTLFGDGCAGKLRPNVTTFSISCNYSIVIGHHTTHLTTSLLPLTPFEDHVFHAAIHGIDDLLLKANQSGASIDNIKKIFSVQDHAHGRYVRNDQCWAYPLDLTSISPWNSQGKTRKAGVLVSPRHALWARHYSMRVNTTLRFVDKHNNVIDRRIVKTHALPLPPTIHAFLSGYDLVVGELDQDVPDTISFVKVFPKNLTTIRPKSNLKVPVFDTDFEEKALVADLRYESGTMVSLGVPHAALRHQLYEPKIVGDSGNPVFMVLDNQLVLLFVFTYGGAGSGTSISYHYDDINTIMKNWGSGYQLTEMNLTTYLNGAVAIPSIIG